MSTVKRNRFLLLALVALFFVQILSAQMHTHWKEGVEYSHTDGNLVSGSESSFCVESTILKLGPLILGERYAVYDFPSPSSDATIGGNITLRLSLDNCAAASSTCEVYAYNWSTGDYVHVLQPDIADGFWGNTTISGSSYFSPTNGVRIRYTAPI